jgi:tetratricopeptide (TPR) repeat protein
MEYVSRDLQKSKKAEIQNLSIPQAIQLALEHQQAGNLAQAERIYQQVLSLDPNNANANHLLGIIAHQVGKDDLAAELIQKAIDSNPTFAEAHNSLGVTFKGLNKLDKAITSYKKAISIKPEYVEAYNNLSTALQITGDFDGAIVNCRHAISINSNYAEAHHNLGNALKKTGQLNEAVASYRRALIIDPDYGEVHSNLGMALQGIGEFDEAIACFRKAVSINPKNAISCNNLGNALLETGELDEAIASYRNAILANPDYAEAHRHLSFVVKHTEYDNDIAEMEALYSRDDISDEQKLNLGFGIGKALEDLKQYEKSFGFIREANRIKRASYDYSISEDQTFFNKTKEAFTSQFFSSHVDSGHADETPIFILGMPRSGTTLVEQILASHSLVFGAGELNDLACLVGRLSSDMVTGRYPECVTHYDKNVFKKTGTEYIERIRRHSHEAKYITDKMPQNFLQVGFIKAILPNAKVILCKRDPMDNCLSIFKNIFTGVGSHRYSYDMRELGHYYKLYLDLMEHWRNTLPGFMFEIQYEELVADQEIQTNKLLEFCGLPSEQACLSFHKTRRKVSTASSSQVRRPMYKDSIQLWKHYETQLEPLHRSIMDR